MRAWWVLPLLLTARGGANKEVYVEKAVDMLTGARHFWLEDAIHTAVLPVLATIFKIPPGVAATIAALYVVPEALVQTNVRLPLGRFALVFNNPQYHRIHHS